MKIAYKHDNNGNYLDIWEEVYPNEKGEYVLPKNSTFKEIPIPHWKIALQNGAWVETATEEERNPPIYPPPPPVEDKLIQMEQDVADLWYSVMMGGLV